MDLVDGNCHSRLRARIALRHNGKQHGTTQHFIRGLWEASWVLAPAQSWKRLQDLETTAGKELSSCNSRDTYDEHESSPCNSRCGQLNPFRGETWIWYRRIMLRARRRMILRRRSAWSKWSGEINPADAKWPTRARDANFKPSKIILV